MVSGRGRKFFQWSDSPAPEVTSDVTDADISITGDSATDFLKTAKGQAYAVAACLALIVAAILLLKTHFTDE